MINIVCCANKKTLICVNSVKMVTYLIIMDCVNNLVWTISQLVNVISAILLKLLGVDTLTYKPWEDVLSSA